MHDAPLVDENVEPVIYEPGQHGDDTPLANEMWSILGLHNWKYEYEKSLLEEFSDPEYE